MRKKRKPGIWVNRHLPTKNLTLKNHISSIQDEDIFLHHRGEIQVISVDKKIISKHEHLGDGSKVLTGFIDIEKLIKIKNECGESRVIFLEKILPYQILELELETCEEE